jgi:hypothetical protein
MGRDRYSLPRRRYHSGGGTRDGQAILLRRCRGSGAAFPTALADVSESVRDPVEDDKSPHGQHRKRFAHEQFIDGFVRWKRLCYGIEPSI